CRFFHETHHAHRASLTPCPRLRDARQKESAEGGNREIGVISGYPSSRRSTPSAPTPSDACGSFLDEIALRARCQPNAEHTLHLLLDLGEHHRIVLEEQLGVFTSLADALRVVAVPRARLLDDARLRTDVDQQRRMTDAFRVHDVEFGLLERRRHLVLHHLHANVRADDILFFFDGPDAANVEADGRIELECLATRGRLGIAEHHTNLLA